MSTMCHNYLLNTILIFLFCRCSKIQQQPSPISNKSRLVNPRRKSKKVKTRVLDDGKTPAIKAKVVVQNVDDTVDVCSSSEQSVAMVTSADEDVAVVTSDNEDVTMLTSLEDALIALSVVTDAPTVMADPQTVMADPPSVMVDLPTVMVDLPTVMVDPVTVMADLPTVMSDLPSVMVDFAMVDLPSVMEDPPAVMADEPTRHLHATNVPSVLIENSSTNDFPLQYELNTSGLGSFHFEHMDQQCFKQILVCDGNVISDVPNASQMEQIMSQTHTVSEPGEITQASRDSEVSQTSRGLEIIQTSRAQLTNYEPEALHSVQNTPHIIVNENGELS